MEEDGCINILETTKTNMLTHTHIIHTIALFTPHNTHTCTHTHTHVHTHTHTHIHMYTHTHTHTHTAATMI